MNSFRTYIQDPSRVIYGIMRRLSPFIKNDELYLRLLYYIRIHKPLNLDNPKTFSEKMQWLKLYNRKPEYTTMVDKYAVKKYVANVIGEEFIIPTIGVWDKPEDIEWGNLPDKFVLKTTHGGGSVGVVICRNKDNFDKKEAIRNLKKSQKQDIYKESREWPYKNVKKRIIAESLLQEENDGVQDLTDYKLFCFDGEPRFCQVIKNRHKKETIDFFDMEWQHQEFVGLVPVAGPVVGNAALQPGKPHNFEEMQSLARKLAQNQPFIRVDFFEVNNRTYFGELTFYPASGFGAFRPDEYNGILGEMIKIPLRA